MNCTEMDIVEQLHTLPSELRDQFRDEVLKELFTTAELVKILIDEDSQEPPFQLSNLEVVLDYNQDSITFTKNDLDSKDKIFTHSFTKKEMVKFEQLLKDGKINIKYLKIEAMTEIAKIIINHSSYSVVCYHFDDDPIEPDIVPYINQIIVRCAYPRSEFTLEQYPTEEFKNQKHLIEIIIREDAELEHVKATVLKFEDLSIDMYYNFIFCFDFDFDLISYEEATEYYALIPDLKKFLELNHLANYHIDVDITSRIQEEDNIENGEAELRKILKEIGYNNITKLTFDGDYNEEISCNLSWISECINLESINIYSGIRCQFETIGSLNNLKKLKYMGMVFNATDFEWLSKNYPPNMPTLGFIGDCANYMTNSKFIVPSCIQSLSLDNFNDDEAFNFSNFDFSQAEGLKNIKCFHIPPDNVIRFQNLTEIPPNLKILVFNYSRHARISKLLASSELINKLPQVYSNAPFIVEGQHLPKLIPYLYNDWFIIGRLKFCIDNPECPNYL